MYFKRELPFDRFFMYYPGRPAPWSEWRQRLLKEFDKVYGIPLGIEDDKYNELKARRTKTKDIDVFLSGMVTNTMRKEAERLVGQLKERGDLHIVITPSVPFDKYCELIARSKVTVSVAGYRWECFRHYEAIALGSVPLMNWPTVDAVWWRGLPDAVFFENSFVDFSSRLNELVVNHALRESCLATLEHRVETHMLHSKIIDYIVETSLKHIGREGVGAA